MTVPLTIPAFILETLGWPEILIICVAGVLLFGKRLPEVGRNIGKSIMSFKKGMNDMKDEFNKAVTEEEAPAAQEKLPPPQEKVVCNACTEFDRAKTVDAAPADPQRE